MPRTHPALKALREAVKGLTYPSETAAPFEAFVWPDPAGVPIFRTALAESGLPPDTAVESGTLSDFLRAVPKAMKGDYLPLAAAVADHLSRVVVLKVGEVRRTAFVIGTTADGKHLAGVKTELVET